MEKLFEASTISLSENFRNANMAYNSQEARIRTIGGERIRVVRLTETIKNSVSHDPRPDWGLVEFLEKEIVYAVGQMREFDRQNFARSFRAATPHKEATVLPAWERYGPSAILPLRDFLECLEHARERFRIMKNQETVELPNQYAAESYFLTKTTIKLAPEIAAALMTVFRRDHGKRFEVFVKDNYAEFNTVETAYQMIAGVRLVFEFGNMPYGVFRKFAMDSESAFAKFARGQGPQSMYVDKNFPKWGWGVCSARDWAECSRTGVIEMKKGQNHQVLFPFPPRDDRNTDFINAYMHKLRTDIRVMTDMREELLPPGLPTERFVVYMVDLHAIANEVQPVYYHGAGFFAVKEMLTFPHVALAYFMDSCSVVYNTGIIYTGGPGTAAGYRGDRKLFLQDVKRSTIAMCSFCASPLVVGSHCCFDCARPIYYPDGFFSHSLSEDHPTDPLTLSIPEFARDGPPTNWELVDPAKFTPFRNFTASRSLAEEHRKITFFGVPATKSSDHKLTAEAKKRFEHNVRGAAVRFDVSIERLVAKLNGKESKITVNEFFQSNGDFRRYYASLFLNCRDKPLSSYVFYSEHCRRAYLESLSLQEVTPAQHDPNQTHDHWPEFTTLHSHYIEMLRKFRLRYALDTEAKALEVFREKMAAGPSEKITRVFMMNPEELSKWLRKTAFTFCYEVPESSEGLDAEIRDVLMEYEERADEKWDELDPIGAVNLAPAQRYGPNLGGADVTESLPLTETDIARERQTAERSVSLSDASKESRAAEEAKKEQAMKKPKFELPVTIPQQSRPARSSREAARVARAPGKTMPVAPPTDTEMTEAVEAKIPDDEEDMLDDTATVGPAPSVDSTAKSEEILMGRAPERRKLGERFFRGSVVGSNVSSSLDDQAEEQMRREETGRNPDAAPSGYRRQALPAQTRRVLPPPPPPPGGVERDRSNDPGYTARYTDETGRMRLERREPSARIIHLPAPPPVPDAPVPPEYIMWEEQRRGREKGKKGDGRGKGGKGKKGRGDGDKGGDGRDRTRTPPAR